MPGLNEILSDVAWPMLAAILLGALLGSEREYHGKPAGLRTHVLVSLGAASFTLVTLELYGGVVGTDAAAARVDPLRIVEGIVGGIGFLGAGSIIQDRDRGAVQGLTTAGSIWLAGAVGLACGAGETLVAALAVVLALLVLAGLGAAERYFQQPRPGEEAHQ